MMYFGGLVKKMARRLTGAARALGAVGLAAALATAATAQVGGNYRLQAGDVVEISVAGIPDMNLRASVQLDGSLTFPLVGVLEVTGRTIAEVRGRIQTELASRVLPVYTPDGSELMRTVDRDQITAAIAEYRPIFIVGDVARPGELPFRPGMSVRQAVAAAGGAVAAVNTGQRHDPAGLRADYVTAWHRLAAMEARVWRLRTELGETVEFDRSAMPPAPALEETLTDIIRLEADLRAAQALGHQRERDFLVRTLAQIDGQISVLGRQFEIEKKGEAVFAKDLAKALAPSSKGLYTQPRLSGIRNAALISSTRRLQTEVNLMQLKRRRTEITRELERLDDQLRLRLLAELQEAQVKRAGERARLKTVDEKLRLAGHVPPHATGDARQPEFSTVRSGAGSPAPAIGGARQPQFSIVRSGAGRPAPATYDTEIHPGDVVDVVLAADAPLMVGSQDDTGQRQGRAAATLN